MAERVGLGGRLGHYPQQLSGGEMQRAAIARAIVHAPRLLVADEPTGNLDSENGAHVLALLQSLNRDTGVALLLATHAPDVAAVAHRTVHMRDGRIVRIDRGEGMGAPRCGCLGPSSCASCGASPSAAAATLAGIALGVAVVVAIRLANGASLRGFETALDTMSGRASLEIVGTGVGVDETRCATSAGSARTAR